VIDVDGAIIGFVRVVTERTFKALILDFVVLQEFGPSGLCRQSITTIFGV